MLATKSAPAVSVVMPVRNAARTVAAAIASIRAQTFPDWELLVVDDGSTDESPAIAIAAASTDTRIRALHSPGSGIVAALQGGLAAARGRFIARMDADDESLPKRLAVQVELMEAQPDLGVVGCRVRFGGDAEASRGYALHVAWSNTLITPAEIALNRFIEAPLAHPSVIFQRDLLASCGGYRDGAFPEDYELWLRWHEVGVRFAKTPEELLVWHDPPARLSRTGARYAPAAFYAVKAEYLAREIAGSIRGRAVWIWGAGRLTRVRAELLCRHGVEIHGYIDIDRKKWGRVLGGRRVIGPEEIPTPCDALVLGYVGKRGARELIRRHLTAQDYREGIDFWMAA
jgi:glycosyltransferase involved in cell wall biosynthesis